MVPIKVPQRWVFLSHITLIFYCGISSLLKQSVPEQSRGRMNNGQEREQGQKPGVAAPKSCPRDKKKETNATKGTGDMKGDV